MQTQRRRGSIAFIGWIQSTPSHRQADRSGKTAKHSTRHATLLTAMESCISGSTYTTTLVRFCTRQVTTEQLEKTENRPHCPRFLKSAPNPNSHDFSKRPFLPLIFLGTASGHIPAPGSFAASAFPVPPEQHRSLP